MFIVPATSTQQAPAGRHSCSQPSPIRWERVRVRVSAHLRFSACPLHLLRSLLLSLPFIPFVSFVAFCKKSGSLRLRRTAIFIPKTRPVAADVRRQPLSFSTFECRSCPPRTRPGASSANLTCSLGAPPEGALFSLFPPVKFPHRLVHHRLAPENHSEIPSDRARGRVVKETARQILRTHQRRKHFAQKKSKTTGGLGRSFVNTAKQQLLLTSSALLPS